MSSYFNAFCSALNFAMIAYPGNKIVWINIFVGVIFAFAYIDSLVKRKT